MKHAPPNDAIDRLKAEGFLLINLQMAASRAISATFEAGYPFFRATSEEKILNRLPDDAGYRPAGIEYSQSPAHPDPIESFTACARRHEVGSELSSASARALHERMLVAIDVLEPIAETLTIRLANALGGRPYGEKLRSGFRRWSCLQLNYSRPANTVDGFIHEAHEDGHLMTLACATGPGLELLTPDDGYKSVTPGPDKVLVMPGEIIWLLSGGEIRPLYHRVRREPLCGERMALLFFGDISPHLCEPWIQNEINAGVDIGARVVTNPARFGLNGFAPE